MSKQDEEKQELTQEQAQRAVEKLQAFYDSLPQDEKVVLESILSMAAGAEVTGHGGAYNVSSYNASGWNGGDPGWIFLGNVLNAELSIVRPSNEAWYVQSSAPVQGQADLRGGG